MLPPVWAERVGTVFLSHIQDLRPAKLPVGMQGPLPTPTGCSPPLPGQLPVAPGVIPLQRIAG